MNWSKGLRCFTSIVREVQRVEFCDKNSLWSKWKSTTVYRQFGRKVEIDSPLVDRNFLAQLWVADRKEKCCRATRRRKNKENGTRSEMTYSNLVSSNSSIGKLPSDTEGNIWKQPPPSQSISGLLEPHLPEEALVAPLLARSNLLITRDIEWANLVLGFEQENRYAVVDVFYPQSPVGFIREQSNLIARQLLRLRRPFVAYIMDSLGNELFKVRRPFWWINSSIYAEIDGKEVGVVHRRWHLWKRVYDLYMGTQQFAVVENPGFWNWTFTLKDIDGQVLAEINRDWRGFGFEIFTDAGQYVIRFGSSDPILKDGPATVESSITASIVQGRSLCTEIQELEVNRPLTLSERAVTVALAISLDNDYFSRHGGWGIPFVAVGE